MWVCGPAWITVWHVGHEHHGPVLIDLPLPICLAQLTCWLAHALPPGPCAAALKASALYGEICKVNFDYDYDGCDEIAWR